MTKNLPNSSESESIKLTPKYKHSRTYEGDKLLESIKAEDLNAYLTNGEISFFENKSREGNACDKIIKVIEPTCNDNIKIKSITIDEDHNIKLSIDIDGIFFEGDLIHKIIPAKRKNNNPTHIYELEFESEKVMIGSQMLIGKEVIEITEVNINKYNKRKLSFTELLTDDETGEDYFSLADGEIIDYKNQITITEKTGGKFSAYILGILTGSLALYGLQNYSNESKNIALELSNDVGYQVTQVSNQIINSISGELLPSHEVKIGENITRILKNKKIKFTQNQLNNKVLKPGILLNITIDKDNNLISIEDAFSGIFYTK